MVETCFNSFITHTTNSIKKKLRKCGTRTQGGAKKLKKRPSSIGLARRIREVAPGPICSLTTHILFWVKIYIFLYINLANRS